jgi:phage N-6-adenine-methyltransferase
MDITGRLSSETSEWGTPPELFEALDKFWHFELDAAASSWNAKCERYYTKETDALTRDWYGDLCKAEGVEKRLDRPAVWLNPPYGRDQGKWIQKAREESAKGCDVVVLIFCRSCTKWWADAVPHARGVTFLEGRVPFVRPDGSSKGGAPASSVLLVFTGEGEPREVEYNGPFPYMTRLRRPDDWGPQSGSQELPKTTVGPELHFWDWRGA